MKKVLKRDIITGVNIGDIVELTTNEKIMVSYVAPSLSWIEGRLHDTPVRDNFDDGVRRTDKFGIKFISKN